MTEYKYNAKRRARELASEAADEFDSTILHNNVYETVQGTQGPHDELLRALDLAERAYALSDEAGTDALDSAAFVAAESLNDEIDGLVEQLVAKACAVIVREADDWTDAWEPSEIAEAQFEARTWLQKHPEAAERAGVWTEVTA